MISVSEAVENRKSIRSFIDKPVNDEIIIRIIKKLTVFVLVIIKSKVSL